MSDMETLRRKRIAEQNAQQINQWQTTTPSAPTQDAYQMTITTKSGKQYSLDRNTVDWIQNRYQNDWAGSYGYDDADQAAMRAGQMSAAVRKTYGKSNLDRQLMERGLPSEKNLEKYIGAYQSWHTGGINDVFGDSVSPSQWTKMKDFYKQDWKYEDTAEDQERKRRGLMPAELEKNYGDTEIDDQLKASGLPSLKDIEKYNGQYWNYKGIDTLYSNVAREWTNLRLRGIKNDGNEYLSDDKLTEKLGSQWYADAFFNELNRKNEKGEDIYGSIKGLFKNRTTVPDVDQSKDYVTELGKQVLGANKAEALDDDFAKYNAFSYDDFANHYDEYYDRDVKSLKVQDGRSVEEALNAVLKHEDEKAEEAFYTVDGKKDVKNFIARYRRDYPDASDEKMFEDMYAHGLDDDLVKQAKKELQNMPGADKGKVSEAYTAANSRHREVTFAVPNAEVANDDPVFRSGVAYASGKIQEYMDKNGGWSEQNVAAAKKALEDEGVLPEIIESAVADMNVSKGGAVRNEEEQPESEEIKNYDRVQSKKDSLHAYVDNAIEKGADEKTVADITAAIDKALNYAKDPDEGTLSPNDAIAILNGISDQDWVDATAMQRALEDYGFGADCYLTGPAADIGYNWSTYDIIKVLSSIGSVRQEDFVPSDDLLTTLRENQGIDDIGERPVFASKTKTLDYEKFMHALDWANEQIAGGMNEFDAYNILAADGYQDELEKYLPEKWHRALYAHERVKEGYEAEKGDQLAWYEGLTDDEKYQHGLKIWDSYTPEQQAEAFKGYNWKFDPAVYRTGKQAWEQQFAAILPGLAVNLTATPVKLADMIDANLTGREELWDTTKDWMEAEAKIGNWGSVNDTIGGGVKLASIAADATQEVARMYVLGSIGGAIGQGTKVGRVLSEVAGNESAKWGVRKIAGLGLTMMTSSPFVVSATAGNFAEAKAMGATTAEATRYGLITGTLEGVLESLNFDELWGKVLGANSFGQMIMDGGAAFKNAGVVAKARVANMVASGLGEFMEESASYVAETFLKMRHADTWGKGTEWSTNDWLAQAGMGFLTGMLGSGMSSGAITKDSLLYEYWNSNPATRAALMNTETAKGVWNGLSETKQGKYRSGDVKVLDMDQYSAMLTQETILVNTIEEKAKADYDRTVANINKKWSNASAVANAQKSKMDAEGTGESALKYSTAKVNELNEASFAQMALAEAQNTYEQTISNSQKQLNDIHRQMEEHYAALYLQNESAIKAKDAQTVTENVSRDMQNGATVNKDSVTEQTASIEAKAAEAATATKPTVSSIREAAYNRVYKDETVGRQAAGEAGSNTTLNGLTRVGFADSERNNFQAKTTARFRRVTLELAGLELAKDGMSAKDIFAEAKKAMTPEAAQKLDVYTKLSKALGLNMVIRDVVAGTSGYVQDGKLYVTLNGKQNLLRVASHELTHYMKDHATGAYDVLRTHLINELGGQHAFDEMVSKKAGEYGYDLNTEAGKIAADDEVCAELCEKMLENKDALERFANKDMSAAQKLKARLGRTLVAIKSAIRSIGTSKAKSNSDLIKEQETVEAWYTALSSAIDAANNSAKTTKAETASTETTATTAVTESKPEANEALYMGEEDARREQLMTDLEALAKKGTRVNGLSYQEVNDVLDRVLFGDKSNYNKADYARIRGMLAQLIPEVTAMVNGDENVDVDALNERVSTALDYMLERYSEGSEDYYGIRDLIPNKIALTEAAYNELRSRDMTLREASNELRKALGGKFVNFVYKKSPGYNNAMSIDELWTRITDAYGEPDGYGNIQEDALALIDYAKDRNTRTSFDDLYGSQREDVVNAQVGEFLDAVQSMVEGKNETVRHDLDNDVSAEEAPTFDKDATIYDIAGDAFDGYSSRQIENWANSKNIIIFTNVAQLENLVEQAKKHESLERKLYFGRISDEMADKIEAATGINTYGKNLSLQLDEVLKILKDHGDDYAEGLSGQRGITSNDFALIPYVIANADSITLSDKYYFGKPVIKFRNKANPWTEVVAVVSDKRMDLRVQTMYGGRKKSLATPTSEQALVNTPEASSGTAPIGRITQEDEAVNPSTNFSLDDDYMPLAERYDAGIATEEDMAELQRAVDEAAEAAGVPSANYAPVIYDDDGNIIPLSERFNPNETDIRNMLDDDWDALIQQYGAKPQGREPRARDVQVPNRASDKLRVSDFTRSLDESSKVNDEFSQEIHSEIGSEADKVKQLWSYIPKSNDETMQKAKEFIAARQPATAQREFHDMVVGGKYGTKTAAIGLQLLADASARDDWASVKEIAYDLRVLATEAGQSAQIFNVLKDLGGVGSAWYVEKLVNNLNTMYADEIQSGQMDPITVSEAAMNQVRAAKTQVEVDAAERLVADEIGPQLPLKLDEKLSNWRYLSMLGNPVTHIRNVTGNNLMHLMGGMKDVVASGVQRILEKTGVTDESDRAHARLTSADKSYWDDFAQKSYDEQKRNLQGGGKLGFQSLVQQSKRSFDNKVLDTIARGKDPGTMSERKGLVGLLQNIRNNGAMGMLEIEDAWGLEKNYKRSLMEYMKAQGYSLNDEGKVGKVGKDGSFTEITNEQMNKAIEWATNQAWTNTFRGPSQLATELNKISKMNTASKLIVEGVMPFKKTPINIAKQGAMYSPAGIVVGTAELLTKVKQGKMSAATAIDRLSSGLTGTALMALGVVLAKAGILRGGGEDKKKYETYLEDTGDQTYAFKFGNVSINMSAIAPATIPLFMGVALQEMLSRNGEDEGVDLSTITDVLAGTLNPFMEMSFMSSLNSALKNYNNEGIGGALGNTILTAAQNYGSQYLPTLGGKVAQFIDPTQRTTKSSATSPVGGNMDYYWRSLVKKVPGAEATLQPDVNIWGQTTTKDSFGDWALDFANKFILPTTVKITNRDAVDNELIRIVESTGEVDFLPSDGAKYFKVKGETYKMNAKQYTEYSQERGQAAYVAIKELMASPSYQAASDETKADMLKKAKEAAYKQVNNIWKEKLGAFDK